MPTPNPNEPQDEFINRCIPIVINDGTADTPEQAYAICVSMYEQDKNTAFWNDVNKLINNTNGVR